MSECDFCGKEVTLPFKCPFCTGRFCDEHRLPENHECLNAPRRSPLGHWKAKKPTKKWKPVQLPITSTKESYPRNPARERKIAITIGIVLVVIIVSVFLVSIFILYPITNQTQEPEFDIHEEIATLNSERKSWMQYTLQEYDWKVWKKQWEASGGTLIRMDSWDDFKESLRQNSFIWLLMLDEENKVIWYKPTLTAAIYYRY